MVYSRKVVYMITLNIDKLLKDRGKTRYWLSKQISTDYDNFCKMAANKTSSIRFKTIDNICSVLEITPAELFSYDPNIEQD